MDELKNFKAFQKLINQADFSLKGEAVLTAALLIDWFNKQESKFAPKPPLEIKEVKKPIKKVKK